MGIRQIDFADGFSSATAISGGFATVATSSEAISAGGTITLLTSGAQFIKVNGSGGAVDASLTPFGATAPGTGTILYVMGTNSTNTVTLKNNDNADGCILNGDMVLSDFAMISFMYDGTLGRYIEIGRNF